MEHLRPMAQVAAMPCRVSALRCTVVGWQCSHQPCLAALSTLKLGRCSNLNGTGRNKWNE